MNQEQIDLIKKTVDAMRMPFREMLDCKDVEKIINADGGQYMPIVISVVSSILATCLGAFCSSVENDIEEQNELFKSTLMIVVAESLRGRQDHLFKKKMH